MTLKAGTKLNIGQAIAEGINNAASAYVSAKEAESVARYERSLVEANERIAQAIFKFQVERQKEQGARFLSRQRALIGKSGVKLEGSPIEAMTHSAKEIELDIFATQFDAKTSQFRADTQIAEKNITIKQARTQSIIGPINSIITGAADAGFQYYKGSQLQSGQTLTEKN